MTPQQPHRIFSVNLHGLRFKLHLSGSGTTTPEFARQLDEFLATASSGEDVLERLPGFLAGRGAVLSEVLDLASAPEIPSLERQVRTALSGRNSQLSAALLREAFADAPQEEQIALLHAVNLQWLQGSVRAVLDELDEQRESAILGLRSVLAPELAYLLLT